MMHQKKSKKPKKELTPEERELRKRAKQIMKDQVKQELPGLALGTVALMTSSYCNQGECTTPDKERENSEGVP